MLVGEAPLAIVSSLSVCMIWMNFVFLYNALWFLDFSLESIQQIQNKYQ